MNNDDMQQTRNIKILIADDHPILRKTLSNYLAQESGVEIVGEVGDTHSLIEVTCQLQPDVILLDVSMPGPNVILTIEQLRIHYPAVQILVLSASKNREQVLGLLKAGVNGYILKEDDPHDLLQAIDMVVQGKEWYSPKITELLVHIIREQERVLQIDLTKREKQVLCLIVKGASNDEIATELVIALNTVKNHVHSIYRKLNVQTRVEAILLTLQEHLVEEDCIG